MRSEFENSIKRSASYEKLVYQHGERLFIFDDGKYKIAAVQLAWEIFKEKQNEVDELQKQRDSFIKAYEIEIDKSDELQKRVDKAIRLLLEAELYQSEPNIDLAVQALKGGSDANQ